MVTNEIRLPLEQQPQSVAEYKQLWGKLGPLDIRMVAKAGKCSHEVGDTFRYKHP